MNNDAGEQVGFLFGEERNGLDSTEVQHAHRLVHIATEPGFSSLNLAQALLLLYCDVMLCRTITVGLCSHTSGLYSHEWIVL